MYAQSLSKLLPSDSGHLADHKGKAMAEIVEVADADAEIPVPVGERKSLMVAVPVNPPPSLAEQEEAERIWDMFAPSPMASIEYLPATVYGSLAAVDAVVEEKEEPVEVLTGPRESKAPEAAAPAAVELIEDVVHKEQLPDATAGSGDQETPVVHLISDYIVTFTAPERELAPETDKEPSAEQPAPSEIVKAVTQTVAPGEVSIPCGGREPEPSESAPQDLPQVQTQDTNVAQEPASVVPQPPEGM
jgi:hypothetical protein